LTIDQKYPAVMNLPDISDEVNVSAGLLSEALKAEDFYDRVTDIVKYKKVVSQFYDQSYRTHHERRFELVNEAIEFIKGHPEWGNLPEDSRKSIISPLANKSCEEVKLKDSIVCSHCQSPLSKIDSDIVMIESLKRNAFHKIEELLEPEVEIERIKISRYLTSSIETEDELNEVIEEIREVALKYIAEGKKVLFE